MSIVQRARYKSWTNQRNDGILRKLHSSPVYCTTRMFNDLTSVEIVTKLTLLRHSSSHPVATKEGRNATSIVAVIHAHAGARILEGNYSQGALPGLRFAQRCRRKAKYKNNAAPGHKRNMKLSRNSFAGSIRDVDLYRCTRTHMDTGGLHVPTRETRNDCRRFPPDITSVFASRPGEQPNRETTFSREILGPGVTAKRERFTASCFFSKLPADGG